MNWPGKRSVAVAISLALSLASGVAARGGPIHDATLKGNEARVGALLKETPAVVDSRDKFGNTALHLAALHDRPAIAALLLANGADVNARNTDRMRIPIVENEGETPLTLALLSYEHKEMVELLLTHGADPNVMLISGTTPLHRAVERKLTYDVELLLANGAEPNARGGLWQTPVHAAVIEGMTGILELLLDYGADPNVKDLGGHTPMFYAERGFRSFYGETSSNQKAIAILRAHGGHI